MARHLTRALREASYAAQTAACPVLLVTIDHPSLAGYPIRLSSDIRQRLSNSGNTISRGEIFVPFPYDLTLPDDIEDRPPRARLSMSNVSREIVRFLRELPPGVPPSVLLELVIADAPDLVEEAWGPFKLTEPDYDALQVSGELAIDDRSQEPYGAGRYTPDMFPGLFG